MKEYFCDVASQMRECSKCRKILPFASFSIKKGCKGGRSSWCKDCLNLHQQGLRAIKASHPRPPVGYADTTKTCTLCKKVLTFDHFSAKVKRAGKSILQPRCKSCQIEHFRLKKYGVTREQYHQMLQSQSGLCLICAVKMEKPCIDHCHATGRVRGMLCVKCNTGIGMLGDDIKNLESAVEYLKRFA